MELSKAIFRIIFVWQILVAYLLQTSIAAPCKWGSAEYIYWWAQNSKVSVPLITRNNNPSAFGFINEPGTVIVFGSGSNKNNFQLGGMSGMRVTLGGWLDEAAQFGLEGSGFGFLQTNDSFTASSLSGRPPIINIPFFATQSARENVLVNRFPNAATVSDEFKSYGFELNSLYRINQMRAPLILSAGFRYINIKEDFELNDAIINIPTFPTSVVNVNDQFNTKNYFYGLQIGGHTNYSYMQFVFDVIGQIAVGKTYQTLNIRGQTNLNNVTVVQPIGLFAEPTNIGTHHDSQFAIVPEIKAKLGYNLSKNILTFVTYNCFYISNIIRPSEQIDRNINQSQNVLLGGSGVLTGIASPSPLFKNTGMWIQGVSAGVEFNF